MEWLHSVSSHSSGDDDVKCNNNNKKPFRKYKIVSQPIANCFHEIRKPKKLMGHSRPLFLYFRLFVTLDSKQIFLYKFADDRNRTADLWFWSRATTTAKIFVPKMFELEVRGLPKRLTNDSLVYLQVKNPTILHRLFIQFKLISDGKLVLSVV